MASTPHSWPPSRTKTAVALTLTFAAGFVDIVGFLTVYGIFTAHMTGTTVHMAEQLAKGELGKAAAGAIVVAAFLLGSVAGRIIIELGARAGFRRVGSIALAIEVALIALAWPIANALAKSHSAFPFAPLAILAAAMGMQTAALTRVGPLTIHTTFVTGMLNRLAELCTGILFRKRDLHRATNSEEKNKHKRKLANDVSETYFVTAIWFLYVAGAAAGTALARSWGVAALYLPCALLLGAIGADQWQPISLEEEHEQLQQ